MLCGLSIKCIGYRKMENEVSHPFNDMQRERILTI
jgi:hypothetical protein